MTIKDYTSEIENQPKQQFFSMAAEFKEQFSWLLQRFASMYAREQAGGSFL